MTLTEIIETFKNKLDPSKIMNSFEEAASFYDESDESDESDGCDESDNSSEGSDSGEDLKNNPHSNSASGSVKSPGITRITRSEKDPLIKLTDVWKIYQMGEVEFAALKGIDLEIYEGEFLVVLGP
ncbi:MAG: ABC transporter ATP-binding protein, partial [Methanosarcina sp.]|nr:ABC transporter ATP-binding protein [Methanosarcina sp.]